ncbi:MAG: hypothetical protein QG641_2488, partial [Candidatus Poribacteria bacterium]|nr:hypothetical protein [Candidatus Poribacteria bacterium]
NVNHGTDQAFSILPDEGFSVQDVVVNGKSLGPVTSYTFTNVTSDHTIDVTFMVTPVNVPDISVSPTDGNFADVKIGSSSKPLLIIIIIILNNGTADLNVLDVVLSDSVNYVLDMTGAPDACGGTKSKIAVGGKCGFAVIFKPLSLGAKPATLKIVSDDPDTPNLDIQLTGNGTGIKGDVNDDSQIRANDAILALRIAAGLAEPNAYQKWSADMNDDGKIRANDAILLLRKSAGLGSPEKNLLARSTQHISITLDEAYGLKGETITIPLRVDNKDTLSGGDICITFDSKVLRASDVSSSNDILMASNTAENGMIYISFATLTRLENETIANIRFEVISDSVSPLEFKMVNLYGTDSLLVKSKAINRKFISLVTPPNNTVLLQNFPNPSNPETWIPYQLKEGNNVIIRIYNLSGELINQLDLGYIPAGFYTSRDRAAHWDGKNMNGENVASGIYFYNIQAGNFSAVRKLIISR